VAAATVQGIEKRPCFRFGSFQKVKGEFAPVTGADKPAVFSDLHDAVTDDLAGQGAKYFTCYIPVDPRRL
jgi:hypothetical protein